MSLSTFLQCSNYTMRVIDSFNSVFKRIDHQNATITSGYLIFNSIRKSIPEDTGKLP